jgi:choice-of-anchor A domain-containing protein
MNGHCRCNSFATAVCVIALAFACSLSEPVQVPAASESATTGGASASSTGGGSALPTGGKTGGVLRDGEGDDGTGTGDKGSSAASGDDENDAGDGVDDDDDTSSGGSGGLEPGSAGYHPDEGGGPGTDDPGSTGGGSTDDPGTGGGNTDDPGTGGGDTTDPPQGGATGDPGTGGDTGDPGTGGSTADPPDECVPTGILEVNVIVFGDAAPTGADTEGVMYIGGDATFSGYGIGVKKPQDCTTFSLVVGGDLNGSGAATTGKLWVGGEYNADGDFTACGVSQKKPGPVDFVALEQQMVGISLALAAYPANGTVDDSTGELRLVGTDPEMNVFSVTAAQIEGAFKVVIDVPTSSTVIVNVTGEEVVFADKGFELPDGAGCRGGDSDFCSHIVWNMPETKLLEVRGIGIQGSIYAPYAVFTGDGGAVDGQVVVRELITGVEFHPYFFNGCLVLPSGITISGYSLTHCRWR